jgi:DHA2 family multidrug resistance protein
LSAQRALGEDSYSVVPGGAAMLLMMPVAGWITGVIQPRYLMALGLSGIAASLWYSTMLVPDASFDFFAWIRVYQMIGVPFLFIPITAASYTGLPPEKTNQASALINVARNLGGSIGISLATAILAERTQFHQSRLVEHVFPSSPHLQETLRNSAEHFAAQGASVADAQRQAIGLIGRTIENQSALIAYIDVFWVFAVSAAVMIPFALMLRRVDTAAAQPVY